MEFLIFMNEAKGTAEICHLNDEGKQVFVQPLLPGDVSKAQDLLESYGKVTLHFTPVPAESGDHHFLEGQYR